MVAYPARVHAMYVDKLDGLVDTVFLEKLQLRRDREALLFLLFRGDSGINHRPLAGVEELGFEVSLRRNESSRENARAVQGVGV